MSEWFRLHADALFMTVAREISVAHSMRTLRGGDPEWRRTAKRRLRHAFTTVCSGCRADQIAAEESA